jgi:hypothetical protein
MYLLHPRNPEDDGAREQLAAEVASRQGFILMATSFGSLIVAMDDRHFEAVRGHYLVEFAGGVSLNPDAPGAAGLQRVFAENVALQLAARGPSEPGQGPAAGGDGPSQPSGFPPGYRPLRWPTRGQEGGG